MKERLQAILDALEDNDSQAAYRIAKHALAAIATEEAQALRKSVSTPAADNPNFAAKSSPKSGEAPDV